MSGPRCGFVALAAAGGDAARLHASLARAETAGRGDFAAIVRLPPAAGRDGLLQAADAAQEAGCDWLLAVADTETLQPALFATATPALRLHDAAWGGAALANAADTARPEQLTRLAAQDLPGLFHAALVWWIGASHFVRPAAALAALQTAGGPGWQAEYWHALWRGARACKSAQAYTISHVPLAPVAAADRARLLDFLDSEPVFMQVAHGPHRLRLPYTGRNPVIEREQARGLFFEDAELREIARLLPSGMRIVDAGANTGNHTVFFAAVMQARSVLPLEPQPRAAAAIRAAVEANALRNVDTSRLGVAVGRAAGRLSAIESAGGGLGATRFAADPAGVVPVRPLDDLVEGDVDFLKIDVEGMEMEVLAGAARLIARCRPAIFVEVLDAQVAAFTAWVDRNGYRFHKFFPDKTHCNYLLVAVEHA